MTVSKFFMLFILCASSNLTESEAIELTAKEIFVKSPGKGIIIHANSYYTQRRGLMKMKLISTVTRSDTTDTLHRSFSLDNGCTWSKTEPLEFIFKTQKGTKRQYVRSGFVNPTNGYLITMVNEGVLPTDNPMEGMKNWYLRYRVSIDGGRTNEVDEQVIGTGYTTEHPFESVWVGKNSIMIGDISCQPIRTREGKILVPVQITPIGPDGQYYNPGGGHTYHDAAVLIGTWTGQYQLEWQLSQLVSNDPKKSTRGCLEPTIAEMPDGRILMVLRGSNDANPKLPGYKWYSVSSDGGYTWTAPKPWTYSEGSNFFSPSSCSQLLKHSNGKYYWLGNITPENPRGNKPRYPFVIGQVDPNSLMLIKSSMFVVDDRQPNENQRMSLSNFMAHEDRCSAEIIVHMTRSSPKRREDNLPDWIADAYIYRLKL